MRVLVIDEDRAFTQPLLWRLAKEGHKVVYCQTVDEAISGWHELDAEAIGSLKQVGVPDVILEAVESALGRRFASRARFMKYLADVLSDEQRASHAGKIAESAQKLAFVPRPDCILLDIMMPRGEQYSKRETDAGRDTGIVMLRDIERLAPGVPVIVITVRDDDELRSKLAAHECVRSVLVKPVTPSEVVAVLAEIVPSAG